MNHFYDIHKVKYFQKNIKYWFEHNRRTFPWREPLISQYQLVISEVLLQRTKAETVSKFYYSFIAKFPNWKSISVSNIEIIEGYLRPIGLQRQRAKRLHDLSLWMVNHKERLPFERTELDKIPLMGQYIANAVDLLIHQKRMPLLDVNMARVLERFFGGRKLSDIRYDSYLQNLAFEVVQCEKSKAINWAILDFAALVCKARKPCCEICLISSNCVYFLKIIAIEK